MRNLKRALSLALASVMLLGMMVVGTSAASVKDFADADEIVNSEAAAITTGLGLFAGYEEDGVYTFRPEEEVNRGIMAAIIGKMVNGTALNFDIFKGNSPFTDTVTFQGGWAEGYANWCYSTGIANGIGGGLYGVDQTVTTWQAALMLQRALGYWDKKDTSSVTGPAAINELSVMAKASELGMLGDLDLKANQPLTRDELSVLVYNALWAQMAKYDSGRGVYVKYNDQDVTIGKATADELNTLAYTTFGLMIEEGVVVRNSAIDPALAATDATEALTTVVLEDGEAYDFEYETGIELIGHAVNVYYAVEKKEVVVYAITDQATVAGMITYDEDSYTAMNTAAVAAGFKSKSLPTEGYALNYDLTATATPADGDYMLLISNSANKAVDTVIVLQQELDTILVDTNADDELVYATVNGVLDLNVIDEVEDEDYVIVTPTCFDENGEPTYAIVEKAGVIDSNITKITGKTAANTYKIVYTGTKKYYESPADGSAVDNLTAYQAITKLGAATLVTDTFGNLIGLATAPAAKTISYVYVAQFGYKYGTINNLTDKIVLSAHVYKHDGTDEIITVRTAGGNTSADIISALGNPIDIEANYKTLNATATSQIGLYKLVKITSGEWKGAYDLVDIDTLDSGDVLYNDETSALNTDDNIVTKGHATVTNAKVNVEDQNGEVIYQNRDTVYFYVTSTYGNSSFKVQPYVGVANAPTFTVKSGEWQILEAYTKDSDSTVQTDKIVAEAMLVKTYAAAAETGVVGNYYYDEGNYHIEPKGSKYLLTFEVYDADAAYTEVSYEYNTVALAKAAAKDLPSGYYTFYTKGAPAVIADVDGNVNQNTGYEGRTGSKAANYIYYAAGVVATGTQANQVLDNYEYNLFTTATEEGFIYTDAKVVDLTGSGVNTVKKLYKAVSDESLTITVSYSYKGATYESAVIYVVGYEDAPATPNQGGNQTTGSIAAAEWAKNGSAIELTLTMSDAEQYTVEYVVYAYDLASGNSLQAASGTTSAAAYDTAAVAATYSAGTAGRFYFIEAKVIDANDKIVGTFTSQTVEF